MINKKTDQTNFVTMGSFLNFNSNSAKYLIIGYGRFGKGFADRLLKEGIKESRIFIVDKRKEVLMEAEYEFTNTIATTVTDFELFNEINIHEISFVVIAISDLEQSLMLAANCSKYQDKKFYAKAKNEVHYKLLKILGIDEVVIPEREIGSKLAYQSLFANKAEIKDIDNNYNIVNIKLTNPKLDGKTLIELNLKKEFECNIIGIRRNNEFFIPLADKQLQLNDFISLICLKKNTRKIIDYFHSVSEYD